MPTFTYEAMNDAGAVLRKFTLKQAVVFQTEHNGESYVHTLGRWYRIAAVWRAMVAGFMPLSASDARNIATVSGEAGSESISRSRHQPENFMTLDL